VQVYAGAFESLSSELQKLSSVVDPNNSDLSEIKKMADVAMKDSISKFEIALRSVDKYFSNESKKSFDASITTLRSMHEKSKQTLADVSST
jgi:hypothetical protein